MGQRDMILNLRSVRLRPRLQSLGQPGKCELLWKQLHGSAPARGSGAIIPTMQRIQRQRFCIRGSRLPDISAYGIDNAIISFRRTFHYHPVRHTCSPQCDLASARTVKLS
jgi:hypothetical protein